ncbi:MAG: GGDEF domain-containing protein [Faecalibacterium sp.]|jgi:diguanylate cyclase (GGDEF)-like protein|nr:GGDEF domain-containing protein [Faecalibacterium sp.]
MPVGQCGKRVLLGDVPANFFAENREKLEKQNTEALRAALLGSFVLCAAALGLSFKLPALRAVRSLYLILGGLTLLGFIVSAAVLPAHSRAAKPALYVAVCGLYAAAVLRGTVYAPDTPAAVFFLTSIVLSGLILDRPVYAMGILTIADAAFCFLTLQCKAPYPLVMQADIADCAYAWLLGLCVCGCVGNIRLKNLQAVQMCRARTETDHLTGLANKTALDPLCRAYLQPGRAGSCALILLDVDDFKYVNETQGHTTGDEVLHNIGLTMRAMFREDDIVGRFGGDEFLVLMKNVGSAQNAQMKAERLHARLSDIVVGGRPVSCSMGVAIAAEGDGASFEQMFSHADMALYSSKAGGKNTITLYRGETADAAAQG